MTQEAEQDRVFILLAMFNGATHLQEQLDSYARQSHANWALIVSDDGSKDESLSLVKQFQAMLPAKDVRIQKGLALGFVQNFFALLASAPTDADYAALSDQDDVWFDDKLERAVSRLSKVPPKVPALYCASTVICDADLRHIRVSAPFHRPATFQNALVQSIGGGNTMVLNRAALDLVQQAIPEARDAAAHDWWLYQIITACGGMVLRDAQPVLLYRQHGGNVIGANQSIRAKLSRVWLVMGRRFARWNQINLAALAASRHRFTPQAQVTLDHYAAARQSSVLRRLGHLRVSGVYRQGRFGTAMLFAACLLRRL